MLYYYVLLASEWMMKLLGVLGVVGAEKKKRGLRFRGMKVEGGRPFYNWVVLTPP